MTNLLAMFEVIWLSMIVSFGGLGVAAADDRPDIVLIMADDMGIECVGAYGGTSYPTPNLDRLARDGAMFSHAYAQPLCTNTRLQLMTGRYNHRNWEAFGILPKDSRTIGHLARQAGYQTHLVGKWQLASYDPPDFPNANRRRATGMSLRDAGFDSYFAFHAGHTEDKGSRYASPTFTIGGVGQPERVVTKPGRYGPYEFADRVANLLVEPSQQPRFVYYPMALPHRPFEPSPISPEFAPEPPAEENVVHFESMMAALDECVGRLIRSLEARGRLDQTLIIFYSDNGTHQSVTSRMEDGRNIAGGKGLTTQNGVRVPLMVHWPDKIRPHVNDSLVDSSDFVASLDHWMGRQAESDGDGFEFATAAMNQTRSKRTEVFVFFDPRPGWDKEAFGREVFVADRRFKLFRDGRRFQLGPRMLDETPWSNSSVDDDQRASAAKERDMAESHWQRLRDAMNRRLADGEPPLVDAFGETLSTETPSFSR